MTREDLQQIAELLQPISDRLQALEKGQERFEARFESLESGQEDLRKGQERFEARFESLESRQEKVETRLENLYDEMLQTRILVEKQDHNIRLIAEQYGDIAKKLDKVNEKTAQIEDLQDRVRALETVVISHTTMLKELKKAE